MLDYDGRHVHGVATMSQHLLHEGVDRAHRIDGGDGDGFGGGRGVLDGQPLVIAQVGVALGEAVGAHGCRSHLPQHIGAACGERRASIPHVRVAKVHLALDRDLGTAGSDLGGDRLRGGTQPVGIDIPEQLAERVDGHGKGMAGAIVILQGDGHMGGRLGRIEIGDGEGLLEVPAGVALGKEPVAGQVWHPDHIGAAGDAAGSAGGDATEVGGALADHRLRRGEHHRDATGQPGGGLRGEDGATAVGGHARALGADLQAIGIVGGGDGRRGGARVQDGQERRGGAATGLAAYRQIGEEEAGAGVGDAHHVAAAAGAERAKVHGSLRHDATAGGSGRAIDADGGRVGDARAAGRGAQVAIDPLGDALGGWNAHRDGFGASGAAIRLRQVGDGDLAGVGGGIAQGEELFEAGSGASFGKVPHLTHRS